MPQKTFLHFPTLETLVLGDTESISIPGDLKILITPLGQLMDELIREETIAVVKN